MKKIGKPAKNEMKKNKYIIEVSCPPILDKIDLPPLYL